MLSEGYFGWYDPDVKKSWEKRVKEGIAAYKRRFGERPTLVVTASSPVPEVDGVTVVVERWVADNTFLFGTRVVEREEHALSDVGGTGTGHGPAAAQE